MAVLWASGSSRSSVRVGEIDPQESQPQDDYWALRRRRETNARAQATMRMKVALERDEAGAVAAECPAMPGCPSQAETDEAAIASIREAIEACLEARAAAGMPLTVTVREVESAI